MASPTEISNLALSHLGSSKEIANLETEKSNEAAACRRFYDTALQTTQRDFPWSFANVIATLALVEADPNDEWAFSYRYPTDCLKMKRILSGTRNDTRQSRVPYKFARDAQGMLIYTDKENAEVEYTILEEDPARFPADFIMAFSFRLAAYIAPRVTGADPFKMGERAIRFYFIELSKAEASNADEQQDEENPDSEFINARN